jgi:hypothetical protein
MLPAVLSLGAGAFGVSQSSTGTTLELALRA